MRDETGRGGEAPPPTALEWKLTGLAERAVPGGLLDRCLATVPASNPGSPPRPRRSIRWLGGLVAAAVVLIAVSVVLTRPKYADAAQLLKAVGATWAEVPASHQVVQFRRPGGTRTEETWFVRGKGHRQEVRWGDDLTLVVVNNRRWEFRWDVRGKIAAAWSTELVSDGNRPEAAGLVLEDEAFIRWAEAHRAEVRVEADTIAGREVRKVVLRWPGAAPGEKGDGGQIVWFDPRSLRPLKQRLEHGDGQVSETTIDYPDPQAVSSDLFAFHPPRDVAIEINDPDLGRQVYSEAPAKAGETAPRRRKGAER